ncbi:MAG: FtsX-like permease family protein, partial [Gammaproteobacteria bacterium]|nr:FtsX-like permease family protein [Gammaproteobacteria bacterium]
MTLSLVLRLTARDWRAGELRLLLAALLVAVGTVSAISLFVDRLHRALLAESATFLAADAAISSSFEFPEAFREAARAADLGLAETIGFPSMVFAEEPSNFRSQLAGVKAVAEDYPLRGILRVADVPFGEAQVTRDTPERGEVWLDSRLFPALDVEPGDQVSVGYEKFTVRRALVSEPDRGGGLFAMGPRLLMHIDDVPATRVIQPGSRIDYRLLLAGDDQALQGVRDAIEDQLRPNYRWISAREASPFIERAVGRAESFLLLGGLLAVLLAGIAVALGANRYAKRHFDHVGVLKTLGATPRSILTGYLGLLSLVGALGVALGLALGLLAHQGILIALGSFIPTELPLPGE